MSLPKPSLPSPGAPLFSAFTSLFSERDPISAIETLQRQVKSLERVVRRLTEQAAVESVTELRFKQTDMETKQEALAHRLDDHLDRIQLLENQDNERGRVLDDKIDRLDEVQNKVSDWQTDVEETFEQMIKDNMEGPDIRLKEVEQFLDFCPTSRFSSLQEQINDTWLNPPSDLEDELEEKEEIDEENPSKKSKSSVTNDVWVDLSLSDLDKRLLAIEGREKEYETSMRVLNLKKRKPKITKGPVQGLPFKPEGPVTRSRKSTAPRKRKGLAVPS